MDQEITHLGKLSGKTLLFGGVYSNLQALEALKQIAEKEHIAPEMVVADNISTRKLYLYRRYCWLLCTARRNCAII